MLLSNKLCISTSLVNDAGDGKMVMLIIPDRSPVELPEATQLTSTDAVLFIAGKLRKESKAERQTSSIGSEGTEGYGVQKAWKVSYQLQRCLTILH